MARNDQSSRVSNYLEYLPAILQADPFVGRLLLAFEGILSGLSPGVLQDPVLKQLGLEDYIDRIHTYFNPGIKVDTENAPSDFLPWLAGWVALSLRDEWGDETKRQFISKIVPLYRRRGTKAGLKEILELYLESSNLPTKVEVIEFDNPPHYFQVQVTIPDPEKYWRQARIAKAIIDQEKPAHTYYALKILVPTMRLTGHIYPIRLDKPGTIAVIVNQTDTKKSRLRLSIKANLGQVEPDVQQIGSQESLKVTHEVTQQQFNLNKDWYVILDNLSGGQPKVNINVNYSDQCLLDKKEQKLEPGLRIFRKKAPTPPKEGNTIVGTESGQLREASQSPTSLNKNS